MTKENLQNLQIGQVYHCPFLHFTNWYCHIIDISNDEIEYHWITKGNCLHIDTEERIKAKFSDLIDPNYIWMRARVLTQDELIELLLTI